MKRILIICCMSLLFFVILFSVSVAWFVPEDGIFYVQDYESGLEVGFKPEGNWGRIDNRYKAYFVGIQTIHDCFPETIRYYFYGIGAERELYFDEQSDMWLLIVSFADENMLDGGYGCIMTSSGDIVSCWGGE